MRRLSKRVAGFSLIELMIALLIGSLLMSVCSIFWSARSKRIGCRTNSAELRKMPDLPQTLLPETCAWLGFVGAVAAYRSI